jgi:hypothetical protein
LAQVQLSHEQQVHFSQLHVSHVQHVHKAGFSLLAAQQAPPAKADPAKPNRPNMDHKIMVFIMITPGCPQASISRYSLPNHHPHGRRTIPDIV